MRRGWPHNPARTLGWLLLATTLRAEDVGMPADLTPTHRATVEHGLTLLAEGDVAFARAHFEGARLPRTSCVHLDLETVPLPQRASYDEAVDLALGVWTEAFPEEAAFQRCASAEAAAIRIRFAEEVHPSAEKAVAGYITGTAPHVGRTVVPRFDVQVALTTRGMDVRSPRSVTHVVAHELGHALGLGDSPDRLDVMGPDAAVPSVRLTPHDLQAARALFAFHRSLLARTRR